MQNLPLLSSPVTQSAPVAHGLWTALRTLHRANPALSLTGWLHLGLAALAGVGLLLDHRLVTGASVWGKPLKFALSIAAYVWTLGWLLASLPEEAQRSVRLLSIWAAVSMTVEQVIISFQAGRGVPSHYNISTPLNRTLFIIMGLFVVVVTVMNVWAVYLAWQYRPHGSAGYGWGLRWGLTLFLAGTLLGGAMLRLGQHTVGAPDGGPGLLGVGWSTRAGDLRIAHFLGIHALQALPLLGWALSRWQPGRAAVLTGAGALAYAALVMVLFVRALNKLPL